MTEIKPNLRANINPNEQTSLQYRLLRSACYLFNIDLPGSPTPGTVAGAVRALVYISLVIASFMSLFHHAGFFSPYVSWLIQQLGDLCIGESCNNATTPVLDPGVVNIVLFSSWFTAIVWTNGLAHQIALRYVSKSGKWA
jgi:hypothetical protein